MDKLCDKGLFGLSCTRKEKEDSYVKRRNLRPQTNMKLNFISLYNGVWSHRFAFKLSRLRRPILKLLEVLLPDGVEDPVVIASVVSSRRLAV